MSENVSDAALVAFDLETTGLSPYEAHVIEIGAVKFTLGGETVDRFQRLADPGYAPSPKITALTGIDAAMLTGCPAPIDVAKAFVDWAGRDSIFVSHNASFDVRFLNATFVNHHEPVPPLAVVDTLRWARSLSLDTPNHKLGTLLAYIGHETEGLHRALADACGVMALTLHFTEGHPDPMRVVRSWVDQPRLPRNVSTFTDYDR